MNQPLTLHLNENKPDFLFIFAAIKCSIVSSLIFQYHLTKIGFECKSSAATINEIDYEKKARFNLQLIWKYSWRDEVKWIDWKRDDSMDISILLELRNDIRAMCVCAVALTQKWK